MASFVVAHWAQLASCIRHLKNEDAKRLVEHADKLYDTTGDAGYYAMYFTGTDNKRYSLAIIIRVKQAGKSRLYYVTRNDYHPRLNGKAQIILRYDREA